MRLILFLLFSLFYFNLGAISQKSVSVVIVPCKSGELLIDGNSLGKMEADDATKQEVSFGEHYLQLKTSQEKFNLTLKVDSSTSGIIKIGCASEIATQGIRLIDKQLTLSGALGSDIEQTVFALDKDDQIVINSTVLNKKGKATLFVTHYEDGQQIFRKESFTTMIDEKIKIPVKGIYTFALYTDALFGKDARLTIDRIPSSQSTTGFNTTVKVVHDTIATEVTKTIVRVFSVNNLDHPNRTILAINLPPNTTYWTYWIGVGQEAQQKMAEFTEGLSSIGKLFSSNPLIGFGLNILPKLPMVQTPETISYRFVDVQNGQLFMAGSAYKYFTFKQAQNITTDYSLIKQYAKDLMLAMDNQSALTGHNVEVRVVAFTVKSRLVIAE